MSLVTTLDRNALTATLEEIGADAWLLFDFHGLNPVAGRMLALGGMGTRRIFVLLPKSGDIVAVAHKIELQPLADFPGRVVPYARWQELHDALRPLVNGKTIAMEISPDDAVPYLDRVPHGVVELLTRLGAKVIPSAPLVSRFAAGWSAQELADHLFAAEVLARVAKDALQRAVRLGGTGLRESVLQAEVIEAMKQGGLVLNSPPIVGFGPNAANPHYEPHPGNDAELRTGEVVLLDLWGGRSLDTVFADQTWMGFSGERVPDEVDLVWRTVRDARDAAVTTLRQAQSRGEPVAGFQLDQAARGVITAAGYGDYFVHRTGHSIDKDLHGSGPHLDDYETHDDRRLIQGVGFSVEPGVYLTGRFGVRSEINVHMGTPGARVTPDQPQVDLITV
ncbi:MAG TPA: M24 family metallopeptidase [Gemmatimonadales bacterium]|nr:M24 family metallopeptidase [Gemmatimonadales bacterium]